MLSSLTMTVRTRDISRPPQWGSMDPREFGDTPPSLDPPQGGCDGTPIFSIFSIVIFFIFSICISTPPQWGSFDSPAGGLTPPPVGGCTRRFFRFAPPPRSRGLHERENRIQKARKFRFAAPHRGGV